MERKNKRKKNEKKFINKLYFKNLAKKNPKPYSDMLWYKEKKKDSLF